MSETYDVSIVIAQYNPNFSSVIKTIKSVIKQKKIKMEVIIADDGSKIDYFCEIEEYFINHNFRDYKFSKCENNFGTCININKAVDIANGEYIKLISPGDYLYDENTLSDWYSFCKKNSVLISYGSAVYYHIIDGKMKVFEKRSTQPTLNYLYRLGNNNFSGKIIDNIVLCDCILGASYFCERKILKEYLSEICGKIKFCEDFSYRLMLLDGQQIVWYNRPVIYYSYGDGISSKSDKNGNPLLRSDEIAFDMVISKRKMNTEISRRVQKYCRNKYANRVKSRLLSFIYFPEALLYRIIRLYLKWFGKAKSCCTLNEEFVELIQNKVE